MKRRTLLSLGFVTVMASGAALAAPVQNNNITEDEVRAAQQAWGAALIQISQDYAKGGQAKAQATAEAVLNQAYGYKMGPVLFKPTLATGDTTFRTTHEGALAYFVGNNPNYGDDGFALKGWQGYEFNNAAVYINGDLALTMGHVTLTNKAGETTTVDKTWGFKKDDEGQLRIVLHHSSLPFVAN
ncbi:hypothetical protein THIAE_06850 [Thiomicrospira aerophila AL3]|uniref:Phosphoribosyl-AMP cyclohydrolase n=1 Tax=Thiomicrospira aerophila AL3 TaxID=717772 RepID=W0DW49_9GAMM|nr:hypothetical protein [Thiomicrospira aerophila]AHF01513.1 hypothetical protein THIAE_06850 [Thiomicrospira aerophila AL3]